MGPKKGTNSGSKKAPKERSKSGKNTRTKVQDLAAKENTDSEISDEAKGE